MVVVDDSSTTAKKGEDLLVFVSGKGFTCVECATECDRGTFLKLEDPGPSCLECADLGHLEFLPSGDTALTRRSRRASTLSAIVLKWSSARRRYERQGILAEPEAIERAEAECLDDTEARERRRVRDEARRHAQDAEFIHELASAIRAQFPRCPTDRAETIARHTGQRGSGRIGRTGAGRALDPDAVRLAVIASVRHEHTAYEELLMQGVPRSTARDEVWGQIEAVLDAWS